MDDEEDALYTAENASLRDFGSNAIRRIVYAGQAPPVQQGGKKDIGGESLMCLNGENLPAIRSMCSRESKGNLFMNDKVFTDDSAPDDSSKYP